MVEQYLDRMNFPYVKIMMDEDHEAQERAQKATGVLTAPITHIGDQWLVGYTPSKLASAVRKVRGE